MTEEKWEIVGGRFENTRPEIVMQEALEKRGIAFRRHPFHYEGQPDIEIVKRGKPIVIFVDGDYFHGHEREIVRRPYEYANLVPGTSPALYPDAALLRRRWDAAITRRLRAGGVIVYRFWESDILEEADACAKIVEDKLEELRRYYHPRRGRT